MKFKEGQSVTYEGRETKVESIGQDGTVVIANPFWSWDEEGLYVDEGIDYDMPFWLKVESKELK